MGVAPVNPVPPPRPERKPVAEFTPSSRRRLRNLLYRLPWWSASGEVVFVTLTYSTDAVPSGRDSKRHLDNFRRSLVREFPSAEVVWKREFTKKGVPHFHLLVRAKPGAEYRPADLIRVRHLMAEWWFRATGRERPLRVQVKGVRSAPGMIRYFADYMSKKPGGEKDYQEVVPEGHWSGRFWGVWGEPELLPELSVSLDERVYSVIWNLVYLKQLQKGAKWLPIAKRAFTTYDPDLALAFHDQYLELESMGEPELTSLLADLAELRARWENGLAE